MTAILGPHSSTRFEGHRFVLGAVAVLVAAAAVWWLQHPPRDEAQYRERAVQTLQALRSHVETARLWSEQIAARRVTRTAASIGFEEADAGAKSTASRFTSWTPPDGTDDVRARVSAAASTVTDALAGVHVAAARAEWGVVADRRHDLRALARRLTRVAPEVRG